MLDLRFTRLCLDIETRKASEQELDMEKAFIKPAGSCKKDDAKERSIETQLEAIEDKNGALNSSPIACIGVKADDYLLHFSDRFEFTEEEKQGLTESGVELFLAESEKEMLQQFAQCMNMFCAPDTLLVTHGGKRFDLPKIRARCVYHGVSIPSRYQARVEQPHTDTMLMYGRYFSIRNKDKGQSVFIKLEYMLSMLNIPFQKSMEGKEVPQAIEDGRVLEVSEYNMMDVCSTDLAYVRMCSLL